MRRAAVGAVVVVLALGAWWFGANRPADLPDLAELPCRRLGFPCTLGDVPRDVLRRGLQLGEEVARRIVSEDPAALATWLASQPGIVETARSGGLVMFRLAGGRRIWIDRELLVAADPVKTDASPARPAEAAGFFTRALGRIDLATTLHAQEAAHPTDGVVGQDLNGDGRVNNRDPRLALILIADPVDPVLEGQEVRDLLSATRGYEDGVFLLTGREADLRHYTAFDGYDVVHLQGVTASPCFDPYSESSDSSSWVAPEQLEPEDVAGYCFTMLATGSVLRADLLSQVPESAGQVPGPGALDPEAAAVFGEAGVEVMAVRGEEGPEWRLFVTPWFFAQQYPAGVRRAVVMLNGSNAVAFRPTVKILAGTPARSTTLGWRSTRARVDAARLAGSFWEFASSGWSPRGIFFDILPRQFLCMVDEGPCQGTMHHAIDLRIREIVTIRTPARGAAPRVLEDGEPLEILLTGSWSDPDPAISLTVDVEAIGPDEQDIPVRLELDGREIARRQLTDAAALEDDLRILRLPFEQVAIDPAIQDGREHELEAIVQMRGGGESRYSVLLSTIKADCYWTAEMTGAISRRLQGSAVHVGRLNLGTHVLGSVDLGQTGDASVSAGMSFQFLREMDLGLFSLGDAGSVMMSAPGIPLTTARRGSVRITMFKPDEMVVGGFIVESDRMTLPGFTGGKVVVSGEFVWTPACPTFFDFLKDLGGRTEKFLEERRQ